jgi:hypothetical protein
MTFAGWERGKTNLPDVLFSFEALHSPTPPGFLIGFEGANHAELGTLVCNQTDDGDDLTVLEGIRALYAGPVAADKHGSAVGLELGTLWFVAENPQRNGQHDSVGPSPLGFCHSNATLPLLRYQTRVAHLFLRTCMSFGVASPRWTLQRVNSTGSEVEQQSLNCRNPK